MLTPKHSNQIKLITKKASQCRLEAKKCRKQPIKNGNSDSVLLEDTIGELVHATFAEGIILEVIGKNGVLRIDLAEDEIKKTPQHPTEVKTQ
jgi:hypothetical protein